MVEFGKEEERKKFWPAAWFGFGSVREYQMW
jgi:hypothetical protein